MTTDKLTSVGLLGCNSAVALQQKVGLSSTPNPPIMNSFKILVLPITGSLKTCLGTSQNESFCKFGTSEVCLKMAGGFTAGRVAFRDAIPHALILTSAHLSQCCPCMVSNQSAHCDL